MVRKIKTKKTKIKTTHPRSNDRGWFLLRTRWGIWGKEFLLLVRDTLSLFKLLLKPKKRRGRPRKKQPALWLNRKLQGGVLVLVGCIGIGLWVNQWWQKGEAERVYRTQVLANQLEDMTVNDPPHPVRITISWYVDVPIKDGYVENDDWTLLDNEAVYLVKSARPGYAGNIVIYGHNTRGVMGNIRAMKGFEKIKLTLSDGSTKWYQVKLLRRVEPTAVQYLDPTTNEILTLYTCDGLGDRQRFIVQATPTEPPLE